MATAAGRQADYGQRPSLTASIATNNPVHSGAGVDIDGATSQPVVVRCRVCTLPVGTCAHTNPEYKRPGSLKVEPARTARSRPPWTEDDKRMCRCCFFVAIIAACIVVGSIVASNATSYGLLYDYQACFETGGSWREASCLVLSGNITYGTADAPKEDNYYKYWEVSHEVILNTNDGTFIAKASRYPSWAHCEGRRYQCAFSCDSNTFSDTAACNDSESQATSFLAKYPKDSSHTCFYNPADSWSSGTRTHNVAWRCRGDDYPMWTSLAVVILVPSILVFFYMWCPEAFVKKTKKTNARPLPARSETQMISTSI